MFSRKVQGKKLSVSKVTFGTEPKDYEVYEFLLKHYYDLQFSPSVTTVIKEVKQNPKRRQREVKKQLRNTGIGTKSQQALKLQQEQNKQERKVSRKQKQAEAEYQFQLRQEKKKEKHRGR